MTTEILFAAALWLIITIASPSKVRIFISFLSASLITILLFFSFLGPRGELMVSIPSKGEQEGYDLPYTDYQALVSPKDIPGVVSIPNAEDFMKLGKDILTAKDLSPEQLKSIEGVQGFEGFKSGRTGLILRYVPPTIKDKHFVPGYQGVEFAPLPYFEDLKRKQEVLDAIRNVVKESPSNI